MTIQFRFSRFYSIFIFAYQIMWKVVGVRGNKRWMFLNLRGLLGLMFGTLNLCQMSSRARLVLARTSPWRKNWASNGSEALLKDPTKILTSKFSISIGIWSNDILLFPCRWYIMFKHINFDVAFRGSRSYSLSV